MVVAFNGQQNNTVQYSLDCKNWVTLRKDTYTPPISIGQKIYFKGKLPVYEEGIGSFVVNKLFKLTGNCQSLLFEDFANKHNSLKGYDNAFKNLFKN